MGLSALLPASLEPGTASPVLAAAPLRPDDTFVRSRFAPHVGDEFVLNEASALRLLEVQDLPGADRLGLRGHEDCFILKFSGPAPLAQDMYSLSHRRLGRFPLFLVPMGTAGADAVHEAVVNRHIPA